MFKRLLRTRLGEESPDGKNAEEKPGEKLEKNWVRSASQHERADQCPDQKTNEDPTNEEFTWIELKEVTEHPSSHNEQPVENSE